MDNTPFRPFGSRLEREFALIIPEVLPEVIRPLNPQLAESPLLRELRAQARPTATIHPNKVAVLPIKGLLAYEPNAFELVLGRVEDSREIFNAITALAKDETVKAVVLDIHSPGGFSTGGFEIASAVREFPKPIVAWTGGLMGSLAYLIGSQADYVWSTEGATVGSIGAITTFLDISEALKREGIRVQVFTDAASAGHKGVGVPGTALGEAGAKVIQARVERLATMFRSTVKNRRPQIRDDAMHGQTFFADEAKQAGLIDGTATLTMAIAVAGGLGERGAR